MSKSTLLVNILASSSEGNCTHIKTKTASILIDVGISAKKIIKLSETEKFDAVFITHEHSDHVRGLGPICRKTGAEIFIHELVYKKLKDKLNNCKINILVPGKEIKIKDLKINNFSTRHDCIYSYGFIIKHGNKKLGYLTDTGSWTKLMVKHLMSCDAYIIEADYDDQSLLDYEEYDELLKERIASNFGHLSNDQTMALLEHLSQIKQPEIIVFGHLSPRTNSPNLVKTAAFAKFPKWNKSIFKIAPTKIEI